MCKSSRVRIRYGEVSTFGFRGSVLLDIHTLSIPSLRRLPTSVPQTTAASARGLLSASTLSVSTAALSHVNTGARYALQLCVLGPCGAPRLAGSSAPSSASPSSRAPSYFRQQLSCFGAAEGTCSHFYRGRLLCSGGKTTLWFHALSGRGGRGEKRGRNPSEDFRISHNQNKTKQNGFVSHPNRRFICSAKLTKCLLCPRLIAA